MVSLTPVTSENWRDVIAVHATEAQRDWVAEVTFYLCLSTYGDVWRSCAVLDGDVVVGHVMWGVDPEDDSHWFGGLVIDGEQQGRGLGRATVEAVLALWEQEPGLSGTPYTQAALSVAPDNTWRSRSTPRWASPRPARCPTTSSSCAARTSPPAGSTADQPPGVYAGPMWFFWVLLVVVIGVVAWKMRVKLLAKILGQSESRVNRQINRRK